MNPSHKNQRKALTGRRNDGTLAVLTAGFLTVRIEAKSKAKKPPRTILSGFFVPLMNHYTLNTRTTFPMVEKDFDLQSLASIRPLIPQGGPIPGLPAFRVDFGLMPGAASFCVWRGREPITVNLVAAAGADSAACWQQLRDVWPSSLPPLDTWSAPPAGPWLATLILPTIRHQTRENIGWLADFEQCTALALLESMA